MSHIICAVTFFRKTKPTKTTTIKTNTKNPKPTTTNPPKTNKQTNKMSKQTKLTHNRPCFWAIWAKTNTGENSCFKGLGLEVSCSATSAVCGQERGGQVQSRPMRCCRRGHCHRSLQVGHPCGAGAATTCPQGSPSNTPDGRGGSPSTPKMAAGLSVGTVSALGFGFPWARMSWATCEEYVGRLAFRRRWPCLVVMFH